ncbi:helix-turn-helix transcriptional regulator [Eggerthella guodeyinii]|uniref:Helix-turn-helix transcriptional regulator n=1 Tax=Eggerthella guodeyinii TaxID=2690837 RepID=A0A6L7IUN5_9ACTN|nr:helix-turn-helix transcriptional regulator [Eggerthella guodeyinii]QOS69266.1 helix-turn-helix transcriptional regulator [Eggerthella guodeyinii]
MRTDNGGVACGGVRGIAPQMALGTWLAWFWLAFGNGWCNPLEGKGYLVAAAPAALLAGAAVFLVAAWKGGAFDRLARKRSLALASGVVWAACSLPLALSSTIALPDGLAGTLSLVASPFAAWLLLLCGRAYAGETITRAFSLFLVAWLLTFLAYFLATSLSGLGGALVFSLMPCATALLLVVPTSAPGAPSEPARRLDETSALEPEEARVRFVEMAIGLAAFFFTIGFVRSTGLGQSTGPANFHLGAEPAVALMAAYAVVGIAFSLRGSLSLKFIRACYAFAGLGLSFATMTMALTGVGGEGVRTVTDIAYLALLPVIWCAMVAGVRIHGRTAGFSFGVVLGTISASSALGWAAQNLIAFVYANQSASTTILLGLGFLCFAYFMFGFPVTAYSSYLMRKEDLPADIETFDRPNVKAGLSFREASALVAGETKLSKREQEVFFLLVKGWSNERIAEDLVVSYHTVRAHVRNIYAKLEVHNRQEILEKIEAARTASQEGEPSLPS